ncbi:MAG: hypothetical protein HY532_09600 [Chloroflexi bacterium]|nr:hypothetical protein [Chloroflexota bacterium]
MVTVPNISELIKSSLQEAISGPLPPGLASKWRVEPQLTISRLTPWQRSKKFIWELANKLQASYGTTGNSDVEVFWRENENHRRDFHINEALFDISVVRKMTIESPSLRILLQSYSEALWQIESEFSSNTREVLQDFGKLVLGSAQNKLFIAAARTDRPGSRRVVSNAQLLEFLLRPAAQCSGTVSVALVPHPRQWDRDGIDNVRVWHLNQQQTKSWSFLT